MFRRSVSMNFWLTAQKDYEEVCFIQQLLLDRPRQHHSSSVDSGVETKKQLLGHDHDNHSTTSLKYEDLVQFQDSGSSERC